MFYINIYHQIKSLYYDIKVGLYINFIEYGNIVIDTNFFPKLKNFYFATIKILKFLYYLFSFYVISSVSNFIIIKFIFNFLNISLNIRLLNIEPYITLIAILYLTIYLIIKKNSPLKFLLLIIYYGIFLYNNKILPFDIKNNISYVISFSSLILSITVYLTNRDNNKIALIKDNFTNFSISKIIFKDTFPSKLDSLNLYSNSNINTKDKNFFNIEFHLKNSGKITPNKFTCSNITIISDDSNDKSNPFKERWYNYFNINKFFNISEFEDNFIIKLTLDNAKNLKSHIKDCSNLKIIISMTFKNFVDVQTNVFCLIYIEKKDNTLEFTSKYFSNDAKKVFIK